MGSLGKGLMLVSTEFQDGGGDRAYKVFQRTMIENFQNTEKDINIQAPKLEDLQNTNTEQANSQEEA